MKRSILLFVILIACFSCKQKERASIETRELSVAEKIAKANGIDNWKDVKRLDFTFNVARDTTNTKRSWSWSPKTGVVILIFEGDTISYNQKSVDSLSMDTDKKFINDKFWLLAPFQLIWDKKTTFSEPTKETAPIGNIPLNKMTLTYSNEVGYTPGDAYDLYYDDNFLIQEWIYRKGNSLEPTVISTWENYQDFHGLKLALVRNNPEGNWKLYFTGINVEME